jgi:hypothetical protein
MSRRDDEGDDREEYEDEYDNRPERRGDEMAHRGGVLLTLGIVSLVLGFASFIFSCFSAVIGLVLGILAWTWGRKDLKAMDAGEMDPEGRGATQAGFIMGIIGTIVNGLFFAAILIFILIYGVILGIGLAGK